MTLSQNTVAPASSKAPDPLRDWDCRVKHDPTLFPTLVRDSDFDQFKRDMVTQAQAQGVEDILDPQYMPSTPDAQALFLKKQKFMFAVLSKSFKTDKGKTPVWQHHARNDAQALFRDMEEHVKTSNATEHDLEVTLTY